MVIVYTSKPNAIGLLLFREDVSGPHRCHTPHHCNDGNTGGWSTQGFGYTLHHTSSVGWLLCFQEGRKLTLVKGSVRRKDSCIGNTSQDNKKSGNEDCFDHNEEKYTHTETMEYAFCWIQQKRPVYIYVTRSLIVQIKMYVWSKLQLV